MTAAAPRQPFDPRVMIAVVVVGVIGFIAMWALIALGPQLSADNNGRGHALSNSVTGYAGLVDLAERSDMWVDIRRTLVESTGPADDEGRTLLVLTPEHDSEPDDIAALVAAHGSEPVLLILPKWRTGPHKERKGWAGNAMREVASAKLIPEAGLGGGPIARQFVPLAADRQAYLSGAASRRGPLLLKRGNWQVLDGPRTTALLSLPGDGRAIVARGPSRQLYVLTEADLVNNFAFASRDGARSALAILDVVAQDADADGVAFDVTLNGLGSGGSGFLRLAFVPPFIGITLCLIAAGLLALWQALRRFGPALVPARAIPISKLALIESSAELVAQTQRESDAAGPWLRGQRDAIARGLHAPPTLTGAALDEWIDRRRPAMEGDGFAALARRLPLARNNDELVGTARAIHAIRKELLREH